MLSIVLPVKTITNNLKHFLKWNASEHISIIYWFELSKTFFQWACSSVFKFWNKLGVLQNFLVVRENGNWNISGEVFTITTAQSETISLFISNVLLFLGLFWTDMSNYKFLLIKRKDMFALTAHKYWRKLLQMKLCTSSPLHWHSVTIFLQTP